MNKIGNSNNETDEYDESARDNLGDTYIGNELLIMTIFMIQWSPYSKLKMQHFPQKYWSFYGYSRVKNMLFFSLKCKSYKNLPLSV